VATHGRSDAAIARVTRGAGVVTDLAPEPRLRAHEVAAPERVAPPRVVALGDSVTVGVGDDVEPGRQPGWSAHLAGALGARDFLNLATLGARARDVRDTQLGRAVDFRPDLATVLIGGNDVLRGDFDPGQVGRDVGVACDALTRVGAQVAVWLLHDPRESLPGPRVVRGVLSRRARATNAAVRAAVAGMEGVMIMDPQGRLDASDPSLWHIDRMHPGPRGHRAMARMAIGVLPGDGWPVVAPISAVPQCRPGTARQAAWLVRHGVPWFAKRSRDLLPELARVCWTERHLRDAD
jgi:lysophospholipase L1-like esterase